MVNQLAELHLIQCSLLPGELVLFLEPDGLEQRLQRYLLDSAEGPVLPVPLSFEVRLRDWTKIWFHINWDASWPPEISVKCQGISRTEQQSLLDVVKQKIREATDDDYQVTDEDYPLYELVSSQILPLLHAEHDRHSLLEQQNEQQQPSDETISSGPWHALLTSHHLKAPSKRRSLHQWSASLSLSGFAKVGHPGVMYATGTQSNIQEFVENVKALQWLALRVRFVEPLPDGSEALAGSSWKEFEKVGEVVEEMRKLGRGEFLTEMGIGSTK
ncbi:hypothetical protein C8J56DRAFT_1040107 [Mycena floridula]|nr:hypothetical protein C8J56DRAFT_1040107 [Mycena floridula]